MREKYPWKSFLNDSIALCKWSPKESDTLEDRSEKKRLSLSPQEWTSTKQTATAEYNNVGRYSLLSLLFIFIALISIDIPRIFIMSMICAGLSFLIAKAHYKRAYNLLKN